jgi:hypothetical protein
MADERPLLNELRTYREVLSVRNFQKYIVDEARNNGLPERLGKAVHVALRRTRRRATPSFRNVLRTGLCPDFFLRGCSTPISQSKWDSKSRSLLAFLKL